tara:strand:+ start:964 stop:1194 length:231 start_codon:yes stop_codon:yes gene_type:complete
MAQREIKPKAYYKFGGLYIKLHLGGSAEVVDTENATIGFTMYGGAFDGMEETTAETYAAKRSEINESIQSLKQLGL